MSTVSRDRSLLSDAERGFFTLPTSVSIADEEYPIRSDFRVILEILVMLSDPDLTDGDKREALLRMFYPDRPSDMECAVKTAVSFINPRQNAPRCPNLVDWERDFPLMVASINHFLGFECRGVDYLHWHSFLAAFLEIGVDSLYGRVLRIREKLKTGKKLEKYERDFLHKNADLINPQSRYSHGEQEILNHWT